MSFEQSSQYKTATVKAVSKILSNAQIKTLPTSSVEIVPAPGLNKLIVPLTVIYIAKVQSGLYGNVEAALTHGFYVGHGPAGVSGSAGISAHIGSFILTDNSGDDITIQTAVGLNDNDNTVQDLVSNHVNEPLVLSFDNNNLGNFTGGHINNTVKVIVLFTVINT